jgi:hypothetical protein
VARGLCSASQQTDLVVFHRNDYRANELGSHAGLAGRELLSSTMVSKYLTSNVIGGL